MSRLLCVGRGGLVVGSVGHFRSVAVGWLLQVGRCGSVAMSIDCYKSKGKQSIHLKT